MDKFGDKKGFVLLRKSLVVKILDYFITVFKVREMPDLGPLILSADRHHLVAMFGVKSGNQS